MTTPTLTQQECNRLARDFEAAYNRGDTSAVSALYAEDAMVMPPGNTAIRGRQAITQFWRDAHEKMGINALSLHPEGVTGSGDIAYEVGTVTMQITAPGGQVTNTSKYLVIWRRQTDGAWQTAVEIWNSNTP